MKVLAVFGTRPEAIKMAPLIKRLGLEPSIVTRVCITSQHREMLDQVLSVFDIKTDYDLNIMKVSQGLTDISCSVLKGLKPILEQFKPNYVIVHGDTSTTFAASLAAYYQQIPVAHVEAGLRSDNRKMPEEINRILTDHASDMLFAPTSTAYKRLLSEGIPQNKIVRTGDVMLDAALTFGKVAQEKSSIIKDLALEGKRFALCTLHRAENVDHLKTLKCIVEELIRVSEEFEIVLPLHPRTKAKLEQFSLLQKLYYFPYNQIKHVPYL